MKSFFKLGWKKFLIFILLAIIIAFIAIFFGINEQWPSTKSGFLTGCPELELNIFFWLPLYFFSVYVGGYPPLACGGLDTGFLLITIPYWLILSYFLTCFIFFIIRKHKNRSYINNSKNSE